MFHAHSSLCLQPFPVLLNWTGNQTSQAWIKKAATKSVKGKALQRIFCILMINNHVGLKADSIEGTKIS